MQTILIKCAAGALLAGTAAAAHAEAGDVLIRLRGIVVAPNEDSSDIEPAFPGEQVSVDDSFAPEVDFSYMVTDNFGLELIAATTKHNASGTSGTTGSIGRLASTWVLPPTLTLQYHFIPDGAIRPYVGAGINWTLFYNEEADADLEAAVGPTEVNLSDSWGWALQAGVDIPINERFFINADIKYIDIDTTATLNTTAAGQQKVRIHLDPIVAGVGVGYRF